MYQIWVLPAEIVEGFLSVVAEVDNHSVSWYVHMCHCLPWIQPNLWTFYTLLIRKPAQRILSLTAHNSDVHPQSPVVSQFTALKRFLAPTTWVQEQLSGSTSCHGWMRVNPFPDPHCRIHFFHWLVRAWICITLRHVLLDLLIQQKLRYKQDMLRRDFIYLFIFGTKPQVLISVNQRMRWNFQFSEPSLRRSCLAFRESLRDSSWLSHFILYQQPALLCRNWLVVKSNC